MAGSNELDRKMEDLVKQIGKMDEMNRKAVHSLLEAADYLDGVSKTCKIFRIAGGLLLIGGGIATVISGGTAAPLVCAGLEVAGAGTRLGVSVIESIINSKEIKSAQIAIREAGIATNQVKETIEMFKIMGQDYLSVLWMCRADKFKPQLLALVGQCTTETGTAVSKSDEADKTSKAGKKPGMTDKERAQKALSVAMDVISVGWDIKDLVEKKGSSAAPFLREKANEIEACFVDVKNKKTK